MAKPVKTAARKRRRRSAKELLEYVERGTQAGRWDWPETRLGAGPPPPLTVAEILAWADAHFARTGRWPATDSGTIPEAPRDTWMGINRNLRRGNRGLPAGTSLRELLVEKRGGGVEGPQVTVKEIVRLAREHHERTGRWPTQLSGRVKGAPGMTWLKFNRYLRRGTWGLPGGSSLSKTLRPYKK